MRSFVPIGGTFDDVSERTTPLGAVLPKRVAPEDAMTPREMSRRWRRYQQAIQLHRGSSLGVILGILVPADSRRREALRRVTGTTVSTYAPSANQDVARTARPDLVSVSRRDDVTVLDAPPAGDRDGWRVVAAALANVITPYVAFLPRSLDDREAVASVLAANAHDADVVYADEHGEVTMAKPAAITELALRAVDLLNGPVLWKVDTLRSVGGFDPSTGSFASTKAAVALLERGATFRALPLSLPGGRTRADLTDHDARAAAAHFFSSRHQNLSFSDAPYPREWVYRDATPSVDIVIPTRDRVDLLRACLDSLAVTSYPNVSITVIDNDSADDATRAFFEERGLRVVPAPGPFNYAAIMNTGVAASTAEYVLALNNDVTVTDPDWLTKLVGVAVDPIVGVVGARVVDPHGHGDHDAMVLAPFPVHAPRDIVDALSDAAAIRPVSAVTGAVQLVRRSLWVELGGMDESLTVTFNDVDLCLRAQERGYLTVAHPGVTVTHRASSSRGSLDPRGDREVFLARWDVLRTFVDPYFPVGLAMLGPTVVERSQVPPLG